MSSSSSSAVHKGAYCAHCLKAEADLEAGAKLSRCSACQEPYIAHIDFDRLTTDHAPWCKLLLDSITIPHSRTCTLVTGPAALYTLLKHPILPSAILCSASDLAKDRYADLRTALRVYAEKGGRLVLGGPIANHIPYGGISDFLASFGVSWKAAGYHRTTHYLNPGHPLFAGLSGDSVVRAALPSSYSCKAVVLKDVPRSDMLFRSTEESSVESLAMAMHGGTVESDEVAVAAGKVGMGWVAWVGDVNQERGSTQATLFLLGLKK
ncbi:hypothetical protein JCM10450v2_001172 [Rhodotorula kratochvilovae]